MAALWGLERRKNGGREMAMGGYKEPGKRFVCSKLSSWQSLKSVFEF